MNLEETLAMVVELGQEELHIGLQDACWHVPRESGFFQPLMTAHRSR
jgi:hypothetical protein